MANHKIYCVSIFDETIQEIKKINCVPVGLGENIYNKEWLRDNTFLNISKKNKNYGELTFYFWFWKNELKNIENKKWIGFSQYRRHWKNKSSLDQNGINYDSFLKEVPNEWDQYETILGEPLDLSKVSFMKIIKHAKKVLYAEPRFFLKKNRNLRFNFGMMHGMKFLDKAIDLLDNEDKKDFIDYLNTQKSLNPANMFICRSKEKIDQLFETLFNWLEKCETIFDSNELKGYGQTRIYAFLSERFLPYWLKKNTKVLEWPILYYDIRNKLNK